MRQYSTNMLTHGWQCRWRQWESWEGGRAANWWGHLILALGFFDIWTHLLAMSLPVICPILTDSETRNYVCLDYVFNPHYIYHMITVSIYLSILKCVIVVKLNSTYFQCTAAKHHRKKTFRIWCYQTDVQVTNISKIESASQICFVLFEFVKTDL